MYGFLCVRKLFWTWERRYFQLNDVDCTLTYAPSPTSKQRRTLKMADVTLKLVNDPKGKKFILKTKTKAWLVKADTQELCTEWISQLKAAKAASASPGSPLVRTSSSIVFDPTVTVETFDCDPDLRRRSEGEIRSTALAEVLRKHYLNGDDDENEEEEDDPKKRTRRANSAPVATSSTTMASSSSGSVRPPFVPELEKIVRILESQVQDSASFCETSIEITPRRTSYQPLAGERTFSNSFSFSAANNNSAYAAAAAAAVASANNNGGLSARSVMAIPSSTLFSQQAQAPPASGPRTPRTNGSLASEGSLVYDGKTMNGGGGAAPVVVVAEPKVQNWHPENAVARKPSLEQQYLSQPQAPVQNPVYCF